MKFDIDNMFNYHSPTPDQVVRLLNVRAAAKVFAQSIVDNTPESPDQSAAIRHLGECVMTSNRSIVTNGELYIKSENRT